MPRLLAALLAAALAAAGLALAANAAGDDGEPPAREAEIDEAVARGLDWLARRQTPAGAFEGLVGHKRMDGYVVLDPTRQGIAGEGHLGVTALAGLAYLADGQLPGRSRHGAVIERIIDYLLRHRHEYGYLSDNGTRMYSHAFATLFLAQVHGMAGPRAAAVETALKEAAGFIVATQNAHGGWRYSPFTQETDLSVTVCQVQALRAARNVGIHVDKGAIDRVLGYLEASRIPAGDYEGAFYYKIHGAAAYSKTSFAINAAAVTSLTSAGVYDEARFAGAIDYIERHYDDVSRHAPYHYYFWYGNYYAAQAMHAVGGPRWERYWRRLRDDLLARQEPDGRWRNDVGPGDEFATAIACLLLRIPAQYLPIFQR